MRGARAGSPAASPTTLLPRPHRTLTLPKPPFPDPTLFRSSPRLLRFQAHHERVLKKFLPKVKKHLDKNGIDTGIYTLKWFFQCFLDRV